MSSLEVLVTNVQQQQQNCVFFRLGKKRPGFQSMLDSTRGLVVAERQNLLQMEGKILHPY